MRALLLALLALIALPVQANEIIETIRIQCATCDAQGVVGYTVRMGTTSGGPWDVRSQTYPVMPPDTDGWIYLPFSIEGLPPGVYYDVIEVHNPDATSPPSEERTIEIPNAPVQWLGNAALGALLWLRGLA